MKNIKLGFNSFIMKTISKFLVKLSLLK